MDKFSKFHFVTLRFASLIWAIINFLASGFVVYVVLSWVIDYDPLYNGTIVLMIAIFAVLITFGCLLIKASKVFGRSSKMEDDYLKQNQKKIFGWGIFSAFAFAPTVLFFIAILICSILVNDYIKDLIDGKVVKKPEVANDGANAEVDELTDIRESLQKLNEMKANDLLTEEEYQIKRKEILEPTQSIKVEKEQDEFDDVRLSLQKLDEMKANGLITEEEYKMKRKLILQI